MTETDDLAPPRILGCTLVRLLFTTPQWVVFEARAEGRNCLAWAYLPAVARVELVGDRFAAPPLGPAYRAVSAQIEGLLRRLLPQESRGWSRPNAVARSPADGLLWMRTEAPASWLALRRPAAARHIRALAERLTLTLSRLHEQQTLHLDVHPSVIGYGDSQTILFGFGADIRRALSAGQRDNRRLARPSYSPPELWDASGEAPLGPWTDVYCTAATLFECVTGSPPADFRIRLGQRGQGTAELVEGIRAALRDEANESRLMAAAIAEGLAIRRSDRPSDIAAWGRKLAITSTWTAVRSTYYQRPLASSSPPPTPRQGPPAAAAAKPAVAVAAAPNRRPTVVVTARAARAKPGSFRAMFGMVGLISFLVLAKIIWLPGAPKDAVGVNVAAPDDLFLNEATVPVEPSGAQVSAPVAPGGSLAGIAFQDDPAKLAERLRGLWGSLPAGFRPASVFLGYREADGGTCSNALRIHFRRDGNGLLLDRPAGLVWVTRWSSAAGARSGDLNVVIDSVWSRDGRVDAPGLVGTSRSVRLADQDLEIVVPSDGENAASDREVYSPCPA